VIVSGPVGHERPSDAAHGDVEPFQPFRYFASVATCPGSLIAHANGTIAGCTGRRTRRLRGRDERHEGDTVRCWVWTLGRCSYCGVQ
jgi:hypothetical protein